MAAKNSRKVYQENSFYHVYNRGVEKRNIFYDDQDYSVFLSYLKNYLTPKDENKLQEILDSATSNYREKDKALKGLSLKNFNEEIDLVAYALLPNHFHFLLKQTNFDGIDRFMNAFSSRYTGYLNRKRKRVGPLYQGVYKAVLVTTEEQLLYLSKYIHRNPVEWQEKKFSHNKETSLPSSLPEYLGQRRTVWVKPAAILSYFNGRTVHNSYERFISEDGLGPLEPLLIDEI